ncbi:hypothetical protein BDW22DRAFT_382506 [Trametopsis cervina]|nr:hypothetical protein BDW22DRAFT_382506 [Trametopsis cervina]
MKLTCGVNVSTANIARYDWTQRLQRHFNEPRWRRFQAYRDGLQSSRMCALGSSGTHSARRSMLERRDYDATKDLLTPALPSTFTPSVLGQECFHLNVSASRTARHVNAGQLWTAARVLRPSGGGKWWSTRGLFSCTPPRTALRRSATPTAIGTPHPVSKASMTALSIL